MVDYEGLYKKIALIEEFSPKQIYLWNHAFGVFFGPQNKLFIETMFSVYVLVHQNKYFTLFSVYFFVNQN